MLHLLLLCILATLAMGASPRIPSFVPMLDGRIVGGVDANIEDYPYQISLQLYGRHFCGASILSETKVLTAGHCTENFYAYDLSIRAGSSFTGKGGQVIGVVNICQHPDFNKWNLDNDVSVLTLEKPIEFGAGAQSIALQSTEEDLPIGAMATVSGWGTIYYGGPSPGRLQIVHVPRVSDHECKFAYKRYIITNSMICFGFMKGGMDSCQGDSGGPLVANGVQVGIVSWGTGCAAPYYPGVYSSVAQLRNHIDSC